MVQDRDWSERPQAGESSQGSRWKRANSHAPSRGARSQLTYRDESSKERE